MNIAPGIREWATNSVIYGCIVGGLSYTVAVGEIEDQIYTAKICIITTVAVTTFWQLSETYLGNNRADLWESRLCGVILANAIFDLFQVHENLSPNIRNALTLCTMVSYLAFLCFMVMEIE